MTRSQEAAEQWARFYRSVAKQEYTGVLAKVLGRAEPHVARLSLIFAIADNSHLITLEHQLAAEEVWAYCERSAKWIFGALTGDKRADKAIRALRREPNGLTRSGISTKVFSGHVSKSDLDDILSTVRQSRLASYTIEKDTAGNPQIECWHAS